MTSYNKKEEGRYEIIGATHEDLKDSIGVGYAIQSGIFNPKTDGWMYYVAVCEMYRHFGIGKQLVEGFHKHCKDNGLKRVLCVISSTEKMQDELEDWYRDVLKYDVVTLEVDNKEITFGIKEL